MGNVIYSFSLDPFKHKHFIEMIETSKNKSALIRHSLHQIELMPSRRAYNNWLENKVRQYEEWLELPLTNLTNVKNTFTKKTINDDRIEVILEEIQETTLVLQANHNSLLEQE